MLFFLEGKHISGIEMGNQSMKGLHTHVLTQVCKVLPNHHLMISSHQFMETSRKMVLSATNIFNQMFDSALLGTTYRSCLAHFPHNLEVHEL